MLWIFMVFVLGASIGSFLNVVLLRTHEGESVACGRSKCRVCEAPIKAGDLVPVLSYLRLRGRCGSCTSVISWQYPSVELATGVLFVILYLKSGFGLSEDLGLQLSAIRLIRDWIFVSYLVVIFVYDLRHLLILDRFTMPAMLFAILMNLWLGIVPVGSLLVGALVLAGFFWLQFAISKGTWVGGGDIRMGALMGLMLGLEQGLVALLLAYVLGAGVGLVLMAKGYATRKTPVPFGSFLAVSTVIMLFMGQTILHWYMGLFTL